VAFEIERVVASALLVSIPIVQRFHVLTPFFYFWHISNFFFLTVF
jgi:hypothetical protein